RPVQRVEDRGNDYMEIAVCKLDEIRADQSAEFGETTFRPSMAPRYRVAELPPEQHPQQEAGNPDHRETVGQRATVPGGHFNKAIRGEGQNDAGTDGGTLSRNAVQNLGPETEDV